LNHIEAANYTGSFPNGLTVSENNSVVDHADISNANGTGVCLKVTGDNVTVRNSKIHHCQDHGVLFLGTNGGVLENSEIYRAAMRNPPDTVGSGWPSLVKVQSVDESSSGLARNIVIRDNFVHEGYGECLGLRGTGIVVTGNHVKDCYSIGIYSNSDHTTVERNWIECTDNPEFTRAGYPMVGIGFAEETFANWGAHGHDSQTVINNIASGCKYGVRYGSSTNNMGLVNTVIAFNTLYDTSLAAVSITYYPNQTDLKIENNIAAAVSANASGATITGNVAHSFARSASPSDFELSGPLGASGPYVVQNDFYGRNRVIPLDAGAMEYGTGITPSRTPTPTPSRTPTPVAKPGDANGDNLVNGADYFVWLQFYGRSVTGGQASGDFNGSGTVNGADYFVWLSNYGR
jgi:hypothetical protein